MATAPITVRDWLARTDTTRLRCRDLGHWWETDRREDFPRLGMTAVTEACQRGCGVTRTRYLGMDDGVVRKQASYDYSRAPGYQSPLGERDGWFMDRATKGTIRLEIRARDEGRTGVEVA